tara:strand:- start:120 stop:710 length:591 start_codon:yes stop_codon:yes gene_type:complete
MSEKENGIEAPEANVLTIELADIKANEQLSRVDYIMLSDEDSKNLQNLTKYIKEAGIEEEINFSDERLIKIWYALNTKSPNPIFPLLGDKVDDWILLQEYMRSFTPADENYSTLLTVLQYSLVKHWGGSSIFENNVELSDSDILAYQTAVAVIHGTSTWDRLPEWYKEYLNEDSPEIHLTASEKKLKELYELLKAA